MATVVVVFRRLFLLSIFKVAVVSAVPQELSFSATYLPAAPIATSKVRFDITIFPNTDTVTVAQVINPLTGALSAASCQFTTASGTLVSGTNTAGTPTRTVTVFIDGATGQFLNSAGTNINCDFQTTEPGKYKFYIRGLASSSTTTASDREYIIQSSGIAITNEIVQGSTTLSGPQPNTLTTVASTTYTSTLAVVDAATKTAQTSLPLGKPSQLKFTFTATGYEANMVLAGARVTACSVSGSSSFSTSVEFVDLNGCFKKTQIFDNMNTNAGFKRDSSSTVSGTTKTFVAFSPIFEMSAFEITAVTASNSLYFRCQISYCLSDSDAVTAGQCGADHCSSTMRKKREVTVPDDTVFASVNITREDDKKTCNKCSNTTAFQATLASLGTVGAILLGFLVLVFANTRKSFKRLLETGSSSFSTASSGSRTPIGSDVISRVTVSSYATKG